MTRILSPLLFLTYLLVYLFCPAIAWKASPTKPIQTRSLKAIPSSSSLIMQRQTNLTLKMGRNIFENEPGDIPPPGAAGIGFAGVISSILCFYSLYVLRTTSCGLPPGPGGIEGAVEGVSYLVVTWIFGWSVLKKVKTGSGLNTDPAGLLGLAEGLSFLVVLGGLVIAALNIKDFGFLPGFLPNDKCFGIN